MTDEEQKRADTCRVIDELQGKIGEVPMSLFTTNEFMVFSQYVVSQYSAAPLHHLEWLVGTLTDLLCKLEARKGEKE